MFSATSATSSPSVVSGRTAQVFAGSTGFGAKAGEGVGTEDFGRFGMGGVCSRGNKTVDGNDGGIAASDCREIE